MLFFLPFHREFCYGVKFDKYVSLAKLSREDWSDEEDLKSVMMFTGLAILNISKRSFYRSDSPNEKSLSTVHTILLLILSIPLAL